MQKTLLTCGILAALLYAAMIAFVPLMYEGYSAASYTVSELSAIGAPTQRLWTVLGIIYAVFIVAFGWGVWRSAGQSRALRITGAVFIVQGIFGIFWPPMHQRGVELTLTDSLHIVWMSVMGVLFMLAIGFAAAALDKRFRVYSIITIVILLVFGGLTGLDSPNVAANLPTPWIGVWERINIATYLTWIIVFAIKLLRSQSQVRLPGIILH